MLEKKPAATDFRDLTDPWFIDALASWVSRQRAAFRGDARPLDAHDLSVLGPHFEPETLASVRVAFLPSLAVLPEPPGYSALVDSEHGPPIDFSRIAGLTLVDTILVASQRVTPPNDRVSVLFQECVHVVQYRVLGLHGFLQEYLSGWIGSGMTHQGIPLERTAARLRELFDTRAGYPIHVEQQLGKMTT